MVVSQGPGGRGPSRVAEVPPFGKDIGEVYQWSWTTPAGAGGLPTSTRLPYPGRRETPGRDGWNLQDSKEKVGGEQIRLYNPVLPSVRYEYKGSDLGVFDAGNPRRSFVSVLIYVPFAVLPTTLLVRTHPSRSRVPRKTVKTSLSPLSSSRPVLTSSRGFQGRSYYPSGSHFALRTRPVYLRDEVVEIHESVTTLVGPFSHRVVPVAVPGTVTPSTFDTRLE